MTTTWGRLLVILVASPWLMAKGMWFLLRKLMDRLRDHRLVQLLLGAALICVVLVASKFLPLLTSRMSLMSTAKALASSAEGRETTAMDRAMRRKAYRLGFRDAITRPDAVSIELRHESGMTLCVIQFEFERKIDFFGLKRFYVPVKGQVEEVADEPSGATGTAGLQELLS